MSRTALLRTAGILALALQCWALYRDSTSSVDTDLPVDKVVHFLLFAVPTAFLLTGGVRRLPLLAVLTVQAVVSEVVHALFLPTRTGDPLDTVADVLGIACGVVIAGRLTARRDRPAPGSGRASVPTSPAGAPPTPR